MAGQFESLRETVNKFEFVRWQLTEVGCLNHSMT